MTSENGALTSEQPSSKVQFCRLDMWEDELRRRMRFVKNEYGSSHPEATLLETLEGEVCGKTDNDNDSDYNNLNDRYDHRSYEAILSNCTVSPKKKPGLNANRTHDLRVRVRCSTN